MFRDAFRGRRVLVTGHTGFKGSWLSTWLQELGAEVAGYSVDIPTTPANFEALQLADLVQHHIADVRDRGTLERVFDSFRPQVVLHLAAQALVRKSYVDPIHTFEVNALGTANVLEAIRQRPWIE
ncbi:MAG: CDP-glucose 4,6-dehydratase, partial [Acidocella sp. 21-58-7]